MNQLQIYGRSTIYHTAEDIPGAYTTYTVNRLRIACIGSDYNNEVVN